MAFAYERLTEQDKEFFKSLGFKNPLSRRSEAEIPRSWVSDREREMFLVCLGGRGSSFSTEYPPDYFYFIWKREKIKIEAYSTGIGDWNIGKHKIWKIYRIVAPDSLRNQEEELKEQIEQAFEAETYGSERNLQSIKFVEFANPQFTKGDVENG